jgi:hypothetical protein
VGQTCPAHWQWHSFWYGWSHCKSEGIITVGWIKCILYSVLYLER